MSKFNVSRSLKAAKSVFTANSTVLLVGATITGIVGTGITSAMAGYKARGIIDAEKERRGQEAVKDQKFSTHAEGQEAFEKAAVLTTQEKVSLTWLCYAVPAITGASAVASCLGVHFMHTKRLAELAGLYAITSNKLDSYKEEAEKLLGAKKNQQLNNTVAQKKLDDATFVDNQVTINEGGTELTFDDLTGRYFMSSINMIDAAVNEVNSLFIDDGEIDLNTVYDRLGLQPIPLGNDLGWSRATTSKVEVTYSSVTSPDGRPAISISFRPAPKPELGR